MCFDNDYSDETTQDYNMAVDNEARRSREPKRDYPCDHGPCPFLDGGNSAQTYFCRDNCGLGVDECGE